MSPRNIKKMMKNKEPENEITTVDSLSRDKDNESNNTNYITHIEPLAETKLKAEYEAEKG